MQRNKIASSVTIVRALSDGKFSVLSSSLPIVAFKFNAGTFECHMYSVKTSAESVLIKLQRCVQTLDL